MAQQEVYQNNQIYNDSADIANRMTNRNIRRDRLLDMMSKEMKHEFEQGDIDGDNNLTYDELAHRIAKINQGRKHDTTKMRLLYKEMDTSRDGKVSIDEFWLTYANKIEEYELQIEECKRKSIEIRYEINELNAQKQDVARSESMNQFGIMDGSVLIVTLWEGKDLVHHAIDRIDPFVMFQCEGQKIESSYKPDSKHPIWNECFTFDIKRGDDPLRITVLDRGTFSNKFVGKLMLNLETLGTQQEVQSWYELHEENYDSGYNTGKIKLKIQWIYSRLGLLNDKVFDLQNHQKKINDIENAHRRELRMLTSPFDLIFNKKSENLEEGDPEFLLSIYQAHPKEQKATEIIDSALSPVIDGSGLGVSFWSVLFTVAYILYFFVTIILWLFKPDFWNLSIVVMAFYLLPPVQLREDQNSPRSKKKVIRVCVFMIFLSFFWDIIWLILHWNIWWGINKYDGDIELGFRRFWLIGTIVSLFLRLIIFIIFWRMSLDYFRFTNDDMLRGIAKPQEKLTFLREDV